MYKSKDVAAAPIRVIQLVYNAGVSQFSMIIFIVSEEDFLLKNNECMTCMVTRNSICIEIVNTLLGMQTGI